jgi:uncharacterized protein (DUF169 family)
MNDSRKNKTKGATTKNLKMMQSSPVSVMMAPSTKEEEENERFARKVGINL